MVRTPNKIVIIFVGQIGHFCMGGCRTYAFNNEDPRPASTKSAESGLKHGELYGCSRYTGSPRAQWRAVHRKHHSEEPRSRTFPIERAVHVGGKTCAVVRRIFGIGSGCLHREVKDHASE